MKSQRPALPSLPPGKPAKFVVDSCVPQKDAIASGKIAFHGITHGHYPGIEVPPEFLPGLRSLGFWDAVGEQDWHLEPHYNDGLEIVFLETGRMDFEVEETRHLLTAGSLTITRPWQFHCHGTSNVGPGRLHWLILDVGALRRGTRWKWPAWIFLTPQDIAELTRKLTRENRGVWTVSRPGIGGCFQQIAACLTRADLSAQVSQITVSINQLLLYLLAELDEPDATVVSARETSEGIVADFLESLRGNSHLLSEGWTLKQMAGHCGIGATLFAKYCIRATNATPMEYLNNCRLDWAAKQMIEIPRKTITEIAFKSGFSSSPYFATQFKNKFGLPPSEYRRRHTVHADGL